MKILVLLTVKEAKLTEELLWEKAKTTRSLTKALTLEKAARSVRVSVQVYEHPELRIGPRIPFIERLAALEHEQWKTWATAILDREPIMFDTRERWELLARIPYRLLPEEHKEADRIWARKVLELLYAERVDWP